MKKYLYCVRDCKLEAYGEPVCKTEDPEHVQEMTARSLKEIEPSQIKKANDQALYYLGIYDDVACKFDLLEQPAKLLDYVDYTPKGAEDGK